MALPVYVVVVAGPDAVHTWGTVSGPVVVDHLSLALNLGGPPARIVPMAFPAAVGHVEGADLSGFVRQGIVLLPRGGGAAGGDGWPAVFLTTQRAWMWPRRWVPWEQWAPGVVVLGAVGAVDAVVVFSVRFV